MRPDMKQVITERPRYESGGPGRARRYKKNLKRDGLDRVKREPMKVLKGGTKYQDMRLAPIWGFLRKNCGRPWREVSSEIDEVISPSTFNAMHIREMILFHVEQNAHFIDNLPYDSKGRAISAWRGWAEFYVDQEGILRPVPLAKTNSKPYKCPFFKKTEYEEWLIFDADRTNVWYACTMEKYEAIGTRLEYINNRPWMSFPVYPLVYDVYLKRDIQGTWDLWRVYGTFVYCTEKRQINKREIRKYKLKE